MKNKRTLEPISMVAAKQIVANIRKVATSGDTRFLSKQAYKFLYLCSGFIAHYNLYGFQAEYSGGGLARAILERKAQNQWSNFSPGEAAYDYYMAKRDTYNLICEMLIGLGYNEVLVRKNYFFL